MRPSGVDLHIRARHYLAPRLLLFSLLLPCSYLIPIYFVSDTVHIFCDISPVLRCDIIIPKGVQFADGAFALFFLCFCFFEMARWRNDQVHGFLSDYAGHNLFAFGCLVALCCVVLLNTIDPVYSSSRVYICFVFGTLRLEFE